MHALDRKQVSPFVLSVTLFVCSAVWFVGAFVAYVTNRQSKDGWSATSLPTMLALSLSPLVCIAVAFILVKTRRQRGEKFTVLDWCGLIAGFVAVALGAFLLVVVWISMREMGI